VKHWQIDNKLILEKDNKQYYAVTYFVSKAGLTKRMFVLAKRKQVGKCIGDQGHELKDSRSGFCQIHEKIDKGICNLAILFEVFVNDLWDDEVEIRLQMRNHVLINQRNLDNKFTVVEVILDNLMHPVHNSFHQVTKTHMIFPSYKAKDLDHCENILTMIQDYTGQLRNEQTDVTSFTKDMNQNQNLLVGWNQFE